MNQFVRFVADEPIEVAIIAEQYVPSQNVVVYELTDGRKMRVGTDVAAKINMLDPAPRERFFLCKRAPADPKKPPRWDVWLANESERDRAAAEAPDLAQQLRESLAAAKLARTSGGWNGSGSQEAADEVAEAKIAELQTEPERAAVTSPNEAPAPGPTENPSPGEAAASGVNGLANISSVARMPVSEAIEAVPAIGAPVPGLTPIPAGTGTHGLRGTPQAIAQAIPQPIRKSTPAGRVPMNVAFRELLASVTEGLRETGQMWGPGEVQAMVSTLLIQAGHSGWLAPWERK